MRTENKILKQINRWKEEPMMMAGMYRLFTYIRWESIPNEYKEFFPKDAEKEWNDDLDTFKEENIKLDIQAEVQAILKGLAKKNITHTLGLIPIVMANAFIFGLDTRDYQVLLTRIIDEYIDSIDIDRELAEQLAIVSAVDLLKSIMDNIDMKLSFDIDEVTNKLIKEYSDRLEKIEKLEEEKVNEITVEEVFEEDKELVNE